MHFAFTDEQIELRDAVHQLLERECRPADVRAAYDAAGSAKEPDRKRWEALAEMGAPGLLVPDGRGGLGLSEIDLVAVVEEAGRVALPEPVGTSIGVVAPVLVGAVGAAGPDTDTASRVGRALDALAAGTAIATVGGIRATLLDEEVTTDLDASGTARTPAVIAARWADQLLLAVRTDDSCELHLVPSSDATLEPAATLDPTRVAAAVQWTPSSHTRIATGEAATRLTAEIVERDALVRSAELLGLAATMVDLTAAYAIERKQFGRAIGSFQAVKHHLANARVRLEFARPAAYRAAWSFSETPASRAHDCSMALAMAADAASLAARVGLQVHGAIGYTWECDLQLWLKRAWALGESGRAAPLHRARVLRQALIARHQGQGAYRDA